MTLATSHFVRNLVLTALMSLLCSCKPHEDAPSPSNSGALSAVELAKLKAASDRGSGDAMYRLSIYYLFHEQDDKEGWAWMEKSAESGNADARMAIIDHYATRESSEEKAYSETLRQKWGMNASDN